MVMVARSMKLQNNTANLFLKTLSRLEADVSEECATLVWASLSTEEDPGITWTAQDQQAVQHCFILEACCHSEAVRMVSASTILDDISR